MSRGYFTYEEEEAHKQGHEDQRYHRTDYDHDRYSDEPVDMAYWDGRKEEQRQQEIDAEEQQLEMLREQQEFEAMMQEQEIRDMEERTYYEENPDVDVDLQVVSDYDIMSVFDEQSQDGETRIAEEELYNNIINDERQEDEF